MSMPVIDLKVEGDNAWSDLQDHPPIYVGSVIKMAALDRGMTSGRPSVALRLDLPDGRAVVAETSLRALETVVRALIAHYGSQVDTP